MTETNQDAGNISEQQTENCILGGQDYINQLTNDNSNIDAGQNNNIDEDNGDFVGGLSYAQVIQQGVNKLKGDE
jgi:hypothetical protein